MKIPQSTIRLLTDRLVKILLNRERYLQRSLTHRTQNDNNTTKNDRKDPNVIVGLVRDYAMQTKRVDYDPGGYRRLAAIEGRVYHSTAISVPDTDTSKCL